VTFLAASTIVLLSEFKEKDAMEQSSC